jgi:hypothetical protein
LFVRVSCRLSRDAHGRAGTHKLSVSSKVTEKPAAAPSSCLACAFVSRCVGKCGVRLSSRLRAARAKAAALLPHLLRVLVAHTQLNCAAASAGAHQTATPTCG